MQAAAKNDSNICNHHNTTKVRSRASARVKSWKGKVETTNSLKEKKGPDSLSGHLFFGLLTWTCKQNKGKFILTTLSKGLQHPDGEKKRIEEDEMSPP